MSDNPAEQFHPLFPPPDGEDGADYPKASEIRSIQVIRWGGAKGAEYNPRTFGPHELTDLSILSSMFGGGMFELVAKNELMKVVRRTRYTLPGEPKPFEGQIPADKPAQPAAAAPMMPSGFDPMVALLLQQSREQSQQTQAMMLGMMQMMGTALAGRPQTDPAQLMAAMSGALGQAFTAAATINAAHAPAAVAPAAAPLSQVKDAMALVKEVQAIAPKQQEDIPAIVAGVAQAVAAIAPMLKPATAPAAPVIPPLPAPAG